MSDLKHLDRPHISSLMTLVFVGAALLFVAVGCGSSDQTTVAAQFATMLTARDPHIATLMSDPAPFAQIAEDIGFAPLPRSVEVTGTTPTVLDQDGQLTVTWHVHVTRAGQTLADQDVKIALKLVEKANGWLVDSSSVRVLGSIQVDLANLANGASSEAAAEDAKADFESGLAWLPEMTAELASNVESTELGPIYQDDATRLSSDQSVVVEAGSPREQTTWTLVLVTPSGEQRLNLGSATTSSGTPAHLARGTLDATILEQNAYSTAIAFADALTQADAERAQSMLDTVPAITPAGWQRMAAEPPTAHPLQEMSFDFNQRPFQATNGDIGLIWNADRAAWQIAVDRTALVFDVRNGHGTYGYDVPKPSVGWGGDSVALTMPQVVFGHDPVDGDYMRAEFIASSTGGDTCTSFCDWYQSASVSRIRVTWSGNSAGVTLAPQVTGETAYQHEVPMSAVTDAVPRAAQDIQLTILEFGPFDLGGAWTFSVDN